MDKEGDLDEGDLDEGDLDLGEDIQLGFISNDVNLLFQNEDWSAWDGGKCGGKPIWYFLKFNIEASL